MASRVAAIVVSNFFLDNILLTIVVPILPDFLRDNSWVANGSLNFHHENSLIGELFASKAFVQILANPIAGRITDLYGFDLPLFCGSCFLFASSFIYCFGSRFAWLFAARSLQGVASALITVAGMGKVAHHYKDDEQARSKAIACTLSGMAAGVLTGYPMGGILYQIYGKTLPFLILGFLIVLLISVQVVTLNLSWKQRQEEDFEEKRVPVPFRKIILNPRIVIILGAIGTSTTAMSLLEASLPIWLIEVTNTPSWQLGVAFIPDSVGYLLGTNPYFSLLALKIGPRFTAMAAMIGVAVGVSAISFCRSMAALMVPHFIMGLGIGVVDSSLMPLLARIADSERDFGYGAIYSCSQTAVSSAYALGPLLGGHAIEMLGFQLVMRILGLVNLVYAFILLRIKENGKRQELKPSDDEDPSSYEMMAL